MSKSEFMTNNVITLADDRDRLVWRYGSGNAVEILDIVVETQRSIGRGTQLLSLLRSLVEGRTHLIFAITRRSNDHGIRFYKKNNFRCVADLTRFYEDEDAVMMGLDI